MPLNKFTNWMNSEMFDQYFGKKKVWSTTVMQLEEKKCANSF